VIGLAGLGKEPGGRYPTVWARSIRAQSDDFYQKVPLLVIIGSIPERPGAPQTAAPTPRHFPEFLV